MELKRRMKEYQGIVKALLGYEVFFTDEDTVKAVPLYKPREFVLFDVSDLHFGFAIQVQQVVCLFVCTVWMHLGLTLDCVVRLQIEDNKVSVLECAAARRRPRLFEKYALQSVPVLMARLLLEHAMPTDETLTNTVTNETGTMLCDDTEATARFMR